MRKFRLPIGSNLAVTILVSVSVLLLLWFGSPLLPTQAKPQVQVFEQVWQTVNDNFFDPKFNGVDWKAMQEKYKPQAAKAKSSQELAVVVNQILSQLQTSHTHFYTQNEQEYYQLLGIFQPNSEEIRKQLKKFFPQGKIEYSSIGIFTKDINGKTFVSAILDGSPAAEAGLKVGDQLLSVDGRPYQPIQSFAGKAGQKVKLLIQHTPAPNSRQEIDVTPKMFDAITMFLDAQVASTQSIERDGKKIGYVHIWSYAGEQYQEKLESDLFFGRLKNADGLLLDLREGWGGATPTYLNIYTARGPSLTGVRRDGRRSTYSPYWHKPVVMLVNEEVRSGKEILAYGFQKYDIGPVVGSKTAGAVVQGAPFLMQDGSLLYVATADIYLDGDQRLEGTGVMPDVVVRFSVPYTQGIDPQKERALAVALEALKQQ